MRRAAFLVLFFLPLVLPVWEGAFFSGATAHANDKAYAVTSFPFDFSLHYGGVASAPEVSYSELYPRGSVVDTSQTLLPHGTSVSDTAVTRLSAKLPVGDSTVAQRHNATPALRGAERGVSGLTWDDFRAEYLEASDEDDAPIDAEAEERLEELAAVRPNLNTVGRDVLLTLPFLTAAQADSLLAYRERYGAFWSLGELMFVGGLDYAARRWLGVFLSVAPPTTGRPTLRETLLNGQHELTVRADVPLYRRAGYQTQTSASGAVKEKAYVGAPWANVVRYRYRQGTAMRYGLTLEKDAGEAFGRKGNWPYDYVSGYVQAGSPSGRWRVLVGDYNVSWGQGLALSGALWTSRLSVLDAPMRAAAPFSPHTSAEENRFFRGAAGLVELGKFEVSAFTSYHRLDANVEGDTVRTLLTTGYHRTVAERNRKDAVGSLAAGGRLGWRHGALRLGLGAVYTHYAKPLSPKPRYYNRYYLRGRDAAALSATWRYATRHWSVQGEASADKRFHPALSQTLTFTPLDELGLTLQHRNFAPRFVSPYGRTLQAATRVANEHGLLLGLRYGGLRRLELRGYADYARLPEATYRAHGATNRWEAFAQIVWLPKRDVSLALRYRMRAVQRDVTGYDGLMEYATTHRLRLRGDWTPSGGRLALHAQLDATLAARQTAPTEYGWGAALRLTWKPIQRLGTAFYANFFRTDSYAAAVYAYEPRLVYTYAMPALFGHGCRGVALVNWRIVERLELAARGGLTHYFDRDVISSGSERINSPTKCDLSFQLRWRF